MKRKTFIDWWSISSNQLGPNKSGYGYAILL
jgi:hypothetical protein